MVNYNGQSPNGHSPKLNGNHSVNGSANGTTTNGVNGTNGYKANGQLNGHRPDPVRSRPAAPGLRSAHIIGWGMKVPDTVITNSDLAAIVETSDEWIRARTGIQERRIASERETVVTLGFEAARAALARAFLLPSDIELIIVATSTPEEIYPSTASRIQTLLGAGSAGAFDLSAACSGFVYALNMASQAIRSGSITNALVIGSEVNSRILDWSDRGTCILFGDGAGAVVLQGRDEAGGLLGCVLGSDGSGADLLGIPTVGHSPIMLEGQQMNKLHMDGREVFRFGTHIINEAVRAVLDKSGLTLADVALIVPHQANQRIISAAARSLNVPESLFYSNIHRYGNTSAASIPIALCEAEKDGRLKPNDNIVLIGFGGGLSWGAAAIQWQTLPLPEPHGIGFRLSQGRREVTYVLAFWQARIMRVFRRLEAIVMGSPTKTANIRNPKRDVWQAPANGDLDKGDKPGKIDKKTIVEPERVPEKR